MLAAAGIVALTSHVTRLDEDHANARLLAAGLREIDELASLVCDPQTNMLFVTLSGERAASLIASLREQGILLAGREALRLVTHLDVSTADVAAVVAAVKNHYAGGVR